MKRELRCTIELELSNVNCMKSFHCLFLFVLSLALFQSCTLEKRRYMDGWHVDWRSRDGQFSKVEPLSNTPNVDSKLPDSTLVMETQSRIDSVSTFQNEQHQVVTEPCIGTPAQDTPSEIHSKKSIWPKRSVPAYQGRMLELEETHYSSTAGQIFGIFGFVLLVISIGLLLTGAIFSLGWTSLGLIISAMLLAAIAFLFGLLSWIAFRSDGETTPWFVWVTLIIGGLAVLLWLKVLLDRARA